MKKILIPVLLVAWSTLSIAEPPKPPTTRVQFCIKTLAGESQISADAAFLLQVSKYFRENGTLPDTKKAVSRMAQLDAGGSEDLDWSIMQNVYMTPEETALLGSSKFLQVIKKKNRKELPADHFEMLTKLNELVDGAREEIKTALVVEERASVKNKKRLMTLEEIEKLIKTNSRDSKYTLTDLGYANIQAWRKDVLFKEPKIKAALRKSMQAAVKNYVVTTGEIPENEAELYKGLAENLDTTVEDVHLLIGKDDAFESIAELIEESKLAYPNFYARIIDRRYFSKEKTEQMIQAVRSSSELILFKLAENQDVPKEDFEAVEKLAAQYNAPIIVAPAFGDIAFVPDKLGWLLSRPNVHVLIDQGLQLLKDFYIFNNGALDKTDNPFVGLGTVFEPTDRVVVFATKVRSITRATGTYDSTPAYLTTTGAISTPAYAGQFTTNIATDVRAQREAEDNRGVLLLSRRYADPNLNDVVEAAQGIAPRRVSYTKALYGNPAGFFDLGKIYSEKEVRQIPFLPAIVYGDIHLGNTDPAFSKAAFNMLVGLGILEKRAPEEMAPGLFTYKPGPVKLGAAVFHDLVDGTPTNGHMFDQLITRALVDQQGALDLQDHFQKAADFLIRHRKLLPDTTIYVPVDNHGSDWLAKKLQTGDLFSGHRPNELPLILRLMRDAISDKANVYERIFQYLGVNMDGVKFLSPKDMESVGIDLQSPDPRSTTQGVAISQHSHMGKNGAKSISMKGLLEAYGANVTGHTHSTAEYGGAKKVGTGTPVRQDYHRGPSSSDASVALVYGKTAVQILRLEKGSFLPNAGQQKAEDFFPNAEFPVLMKFNRPPGGPTSDAQRSRPPVDRSRR